MKLSNLDLSELCFRTSEEVIPLLQSACESNPDLAEFEIIGQSEEGRPIVGITLGYGPKLVTLIAGAHADEPVGPETLRTLVLEGLANRDWLAEDGGLHAVFEEFTFKIIPHINPDGEARNRRWIESWPDLESFLRFRYREEPGRDIEFGYPEMRVENRIAANFLFESGHVELHMSLHGMAFSEGALLLIEKSWSECADELKAGFQDVAAQVGMRLHDHDRAGDKGFQYYGPGFWSTPEGTAMQNYFREQGDKETADKFFLSSMELAMQKGSNPETEKTTRCLVTELPLFYVSATYDHKSGIPKLLNMFRDELAALDTEVDTFNQKVAELEKFYAIQPVPLPKAVNAHLATVDLALGEVRSSANPISNTLRGK